MKAAIHAKVSTEEQQKEGTSLESQTEACSKLAKEKGYDVPECLIFRETFSALTMDRPQLTKVRQKVKGGELTAIIIHTPDRLLG